MKTNEIITLMSDNKNKMLKAEQLQTVLKKNLEMKEYISIKVKKELIDNIVNECILYEDGVFKFNDVDKYICFTMRTIEAYTNLELSDDIENDYDLLCQHGLLNSIIDAFIGEYDNVKVLFQMKCDGILRNNTIEVQFGRFLECVLEKVEDVADALKDKASEFNVSNLPVNKEDLNKLIAFMESKNNK